MTVLGLSYLAARFHRSFGTDETEFAVSIDCAQYHAFAHYSAQLAWLEVGNENHLFADEFRRVRIALRDAGDNGAATHPVIYAELQQFVCFGHFGAF